jgi:hypothetical protein
LPVVFADIPGASDELLGISQVVNVAQLVVHLESERARLKDLGIEGLLRKDLVEAGSVLKVRNR